MELTWQKDIRMSLPKQDLDFYNVSSIAMADGSGYAAELGVHHELHCLVRPSLPFPLLSKLILGGHTQLMHL